MKNLLLIMLMGVTTFLFAQTIAPKKCNTCGKSLAQCQYKGKHPKQPPKQDQKPVQEQPSKPVQPIKPASGYENGHEWVDLGLSVKWATCNIGANSPSDYGGYYAWGETSTKSRYDWDNCFDCLDSTGDRWGIYRDGGKVLITPTNGHDTARENWGGKWRMPTVAEIDDLCKRCTWTWTDWGYCVTGQNGNSIFLPAAGHRAGTVSYDIGKSGSYLSCERAYGQNSGAWDLGFSSSYHGRYSISRMCGSSVRPVIE